ncbi:ZN414 protein, partial [Atractosteus spatula]|nr:ZN414 protein [Atractosteus spatula]
GKQFHCSTLGCTGTFPSMQKLMDHTRHHYKPNRYFLCESCRSRLRTHRAFFKHLHICQKVAKSRAPPKPEKTEPVAPAACDRVNDDDDDDDEDDEEEGPPALAPGPAVLFQLPAPFGAPAPAPAEPGPRAFLSYVPPGSLSLPQAAVHQRLRILGPSPPGLPGSNAVWKKNQGQSFNSRIVWEHTRGRYSCLQCQHSTPSRQEMTIHIEEQHKSPSSRAHGPLGKGFFRRTVPCPAGPGDTTLPAACCPAGPTTLPAARCPAGPMTLPAARCPAGPTTLPAVRLGPRHCPLSGWARGHDTSHFLITVDLFQ